MGFITTFHYSIGEIFSQPGSFARFFRVILVGVLDPQFGFSKRSPGRSRKCLNSLGGDQTMLKSIVIIRDFPQNNTLLGTNISPGKSILKMIFLFPRWDMLIPKKGSAWGLDPGVMQFPPAGRAQLKKPNGWLISWRFMNFQKGWT